MIALSLSYLFRETYNADCELIGIVEEDNKPLWYVYDVNVNGTRMIVTVGLDGAGFYRDLQDLEFVIEMRKRNTKRDIKFTSFKR